MVSQLRGDRHATLIVLSAIASDEELQNTLLLKGGYATEALSRNPRTTIDVDVTTRDSRWEEQYPELTDRRDFIRQKFKSAVERYTRKTDKWRLSNIGVQKNPESKPHRFGWDGYSINVILKHSGKQEYLVQIDLSFGDATDGVALLRLTPHSIELTNTKDNYLVIYAYNPEQQIAEKLRAFLQCLPAHANKIGAGTYAPRIRDIRDIAVLYQTFRESLSMERIALLFVEKCRKKTVDCEGLKDFVPDPDSEERYRELYDDDETLATLPFEEAWKEMKSLIHIITTEYPPPGHFPLPPVVEKKPNTILKS